MVDRAPSPSYREIVRIPAFFVFLSGRVISHLGGNVFELASLWYIAGHSVSPLSTIGVLLVPAVITTVLQLPLAALADRWPKKPLLILVELGRGLAILGAVLWISHGGSAVAIVYGALGLITVGRLLVAPALTVAWPSVLPDPDRQLVVANSLWEIVWRVLNLVGYPLAGVLVAVVGPPRAMGLDGIAYLASALSFAWLSIPTIRATATPGLRGFLRDMGEGLRYLWGHTGFRAFLIAFVAINVVSSPLSVFAVFYTKDVLHGGPVLLGWLYGAEAVGGILGAWWVGRHPLQRPLHGLLGGVVVIAGVSLVAAILWPVPAVGLVTVAARAGIWALINVPFFAALQISPPPDLRGRVVSSFSLVTGQLPGLVGLWGAGSVMGLLTVPATFFGIGVMILAMGLAILAWPRARALDMVVIPGREQAARPL